MPQHARVAAILTSKHKQGFVSVKADHDCLKQAIKDQAGQITTKSRIARLCLMSDIWSNGVMQALGPRDPKIMGVYNMGAAMLADTDEPEASEHQSYRDRIKARLNLDDLSMNSPYWEPLTGWPSSSPKLPPVP